MTREARLQGAVAALLGVVVGLAVVAVGDLAHSPDPAPAPRYVEVEVPDRVLECVTWDRGISCNWADPLVAVSSVGPIERDDIENGALHAT